jgi:hypothetical protein
LAAALALGASAIGPGWAHGQAGPAQAPQRASARDLEILVDFLMPRAGIADVLRVRFEEAYRAAHRADPIHITLEQRYPGIHAVMTSAALEEMLGSVTGQFDRIGDAVQADLRANLSADDIHALARLLRHPAARALSQTRLAPRDGETTAQMIARSRRETESAAATSSAVADLERQLQAFAATPRGQRLLPALGALQEPARRRLAEAATSAQVGAVQAGMRAANAFVRRSHPADAPPFPNVPAR